MQSLNVLIIADESSKALKAVLKSKYLNKLFTNFEASGAVDIRFNTFKELAQKCKSLKIDIVIVEDEKMILQGIADVLRKNFVNCIALNSFWTQLILSSDFARKMTAKYGIDTPDVLSYPEEFPIVVRADGILRFANSLEEVIKIRQDIYDFSPEIAKSIFLERYIKGEEFLLYSFFDGKNLITFSPQGLDTKTYNDKLEYMFVQENPNFIGYITSRVMLSDEKLYNLGFNLDFPRLDDDIIFVLISAIYQKLNELRL